jgi:hypothetical protein
VLKLRKGTVVAGDPLTVKVGDEERRAWADPALVGPAEEGDEVIVNTEALDLSLGSGGFDVVHVNLTRGLDGEGAPPDQHVMKLNYTSLQHPVEPVEEPHDADWRPARPIPVLVCFLHGQGTLSRDVAGLRERGLLAGHITAGPCFGGEHEAISLTGALHAAAGSLGWDAAIVAPGPGILGSATRYGHGGMAALDAAHASLALGLPTAVAPRLSAGDARERHRGLSHHTQAVLRLLLAPVRVASPDGADSAFELEAGTSELHQLVHVPVDLDGYGQSGLPTRTMGREIDEDADFFAAALAGGALLASMTEDA